MEAKFVFANLAVLLLCFSTVAHSTADYGDYTCIYTVYVKTANTTHAGTDSKISLDLLDDTGAGFLIRDLEAWGGVMGEGHDYFESGNLDIFTGRGPCLKHPACAMAITSDASGSNYDWYCNYVEVATVSFQAQAQAQCAQLTFTVNQWLSREKYPYLLYAFRNNCPNAALNRHPKKLVPVDTL